MKKNILRLLLLVMTLSCILVIPYSPASAYQVYDNYRVTHTPTEVTIVGYDTDAAKKETSITIPSTINGKPVTAIDFEENNPFVTGFSECTKLQYIYIPETVVSIAPGCFSNTALKQIEVSADNPKYTSYGDALYDKDKTVLIQYPVDSDNITYKIPDTVIKIDSYAFAGATKLENIALPVNIESLEDHVFYNCKVLNKVDMSMCNKLRYVGESCFEASKKLSAVLLPNLESVVAASDTGVLVMDKRVFAECSALAEIELPVGLASLGDMAFYNCKALYGSKITVSGETEGTDIVYTELIIPEKTTDIGASTFEGCSALVKVDIPSTVKTISKRAFYGCSALSEINLKDTLEIVGESAFENCTKLLEFTIGSHGKEIQQNAFKNCSLLNKITFLEGVELIGDGAFYGCKKLSSMVLPWSVKKIGASAFESCVELLGVDIPTSVNEIGERTFFDCKSLESFVFLKDENVKVAVNKIGASAFEGCVVLTAFEFPSTLTEIADRTFYGCKLLGEIDIPGNVSLIGESAFEGCAALTELTIKSGVETISKNAFKDCKGITGITLENGLKTIGETAFINAANTKEPFNIEIPSSVTSIGKSAFENVKGIKTAFIKANVETIEEGTFRGCAALVRVELPDSLITVGKEAFSNCGALGIVKFNDGLENIESNAFQKSSNAKNLLKITIPESVKNIGSEAFADMKGLDTVVLNADVEVLPTGIFTNSGLRSITLPKNLKTIASKSFEKCSNLSEVIFNDTLETIEAEAFVGSTSKNSSLDLVIPKSVKTIGESAFSGMAGLNSVTINEGVTEISNNTFKSSSITKAVLPSTIEAIGEGAFNGCKNLSGILLPENLKTIKATAFSGSGITAIKIPDSVTYVGQSAFEKCESLESVRTSAGMSTIEEAVFAGCDNITDLVITEGVVLIGTDAFEGCASLTELTLPDGLIEVGKTAFSGCEGLVNINFPSTLVTIGTSAFAKCEALLDVKLPKGLKTIGEKAFDNCTAMVSVFIPSTVVDIETVDSKGKVHITPGIGKNAFQMCESLSSVNFEDGLKSIGGEGVFNKCEMLTDVVIPESVDTIANKVFDGCDALMSATFSGNAPTNFGTDVFGKPAKANERGFVIYYCEGNTGFDNPWNGYSCTQISITKFDITPPDKTTYQEGEEFDPTGMRVFVTFDTGVTQEIIDYDLKGYTSTPGIKTMTVTYLGKSATFEVTVLNPMVEKIEIVPPKKITYLQGDKEIDTTGMEVTAYYNNGKKVNLLASEYRVLGFDTTTPGTKTLTVTYSGLEKNFDIVVIEVIEGKELSSIEVVSEPKKEYIEGEEFDKTGMMVMAVYNKGTLSETREEIDIYEVSGADTSKPGTPIVTITYAGKTAQFAITVRAKTLLSISVTPPNKTVYLKGEEFDKTGMVVTANYDNGKSEEVDGYSIMGYDAETPSKQKITVVYNGVSTEFEVIVTVDETTSKVCEMKLVGIPSRKDTKLTFLLDINNMTQSKRNVSVIVAAYKSASGALGGTTKIYPMTIDSGHSEVKADIWVGTDVGIENCYFKVFLWDGVNVTKGDMLAPNADAIKYVP